jgi:hypothetical protein
MPAAQVSCLAHFLVLQTESAEILYTIASVTSFISAFTFKNAANLSERLVSHMADLFTGGSMQTYVQYLLAL